MKIINHYEVIEVEDVGGIDALRRLTTWLKDNGFSYGDGGSHGIHKEAVVYAKGYKKLEGSG